MRAVMFWEPGSIPVKPLVAEANLSAVMRMLSLAAPGSEVIVAPPIDRETGDDQILTSIIEDTARRAGLIYRVEQYKLPVDVLDDDLNFMHTDLGWEVMICPRDGLVELSGLANAAGFSIVDVDVTGRGLR